MFRYLNIKILYSNIVIFRFSDIKIFDIGILTCCMLISQFFFGQKYFNNDINFSQCLNF